MKVSVKHPSEFLPAIVTDQIRNDAFTGRTRKKFDGRYSVMSFMSKSGSICMSQKRMVVWASRFQKS